MRLANGALFPMPITLDMSAEQISSYGVKQGSRVVLADPRDDRALAILTSESQACVCFFPAPIAKPCPCSLVGLQARQGRGVD